MLNKIKILIFFSKSDVARSQPRHTMGSAGSHAAGTTGNNREPAVF